MPVGEAFYLVTGQALLAQSESLVSSTEQFARSLRPMQP